MPSMTFVIRLLPGIVMEFKMGENVTRRTPQERCTATLFLLTFLLVAHKRKVSVLVARSGTFVTLSRGRRVTTYP